jgi:hypothetical protein
MMHTVVRFPILGNFTSRHAESMWLEVIARHNSDDERAVAIAPVTQG